MNKKEQSKGAPQISVKIDAEVDRMWRELFGTQKARGKESLTIRQATETAFLLFVCLPEDARYFLSNRLLDPPFQKKLARILLSEWQQLKESLSAEE